MLDNSQFRGALLIAIILGQGLTVLAVGAGGVSWTFSLTYHLSSFSLSLGDGSV